MPNMHVYIGLFLLNTFEGHNSVYSNFFSNFHQVIVINIIIYFVIIRLFHFCLEDFVIIDFDFVLNVWLDGIDRD